jgi:hypothetical protein
MPVLPRPLWAIRLKGGRKIHLTEPNEPDGGPFDVTLCGRRHDPADRTKGTKSTRVDEAVCQRCLVNSGYVDEHGRWLANLTKCAEVLRSHLDLPSEDLREILLRVAEVRERKS